MSPKQQLVPAGNDFDAPEGFDQGMQGAFGDQVQLPFFAPFVSWDNGNAAYRQSTAAAAYTGGWSMFADAAEILSKDYEHMHSHFQLIENLQKGDKEVTGWMAQWLPVAVIGQRMRWIAEEGQRPRSHLQVLVMTAEADKDGVMAAYAPMVLTVKGQNGTTTLQGALGEWRAKSAKARRDLAKGLSESAFWVPLGVFTKKREAIMIGTAPNQKQVVPIKLHMPDELTVDVLRRLYVGREVAEYMLDLRSQAEPWLNEWKRQAAEAKAQGIDPAQAAGAGRNVPQLVEDDFVPEEE